MWSFLADLKYEIYIKKRLKNHNNYIILREITVDIHMYEVCLEEI